MVAYPLNLLVVEGNDKIHNIILSTYFKYFVFYATCNESRLTVERNLLDGNELN